MHGSTRLITFALTAIALVSASGSARAQYPSPRPPFTYIYPKAPDLTGTGVYSASPYGMFYGPNLSVVPCHMPFQGMVTAPSGGGCGGLGGMNGFPGVPYNPFIRSPRDFFMHD